MSGIFGIAISGLNAAQAGLVTTGHNIANASTPGFHRQQVAQSNSLPTVTGAGYIGSGVQVDTIKRVYSDFLDSQASRAASQAAYYSAYSDQIGQIDNILSDPSAGLAPELESFFSAVHEVASNPSSVASRQALLSAGSSLTGRFQSLDNRFVEMNRGVNAQLVSAISGINTYAREIAQLNLQITSSRANPDQPANDLLDKRDQLISELNSLVGATTVQQPDGNVSVSIGNGQSLVVGSRSFQLSTINSPEVPDQTDVAYVTGGSTVALGPNTITGGSLGALLAFRAGPLTDARNELGRIASGIASTFNAQHQLGQDLTGTMGGNFFTTPVGSATANANNPTPGASVSVSLLQGSVRAASDYRLDYVGGATPYKITRLADNTSTSYATLPQTIEGVSIQLTSGAAANGDTFLIGRTGNLTPGVSNTGTAALNVGVGDTWALSGSDYRLAYVGGTNPYQLTRLSDGNIRNYASVPQTVDGMSIQSTGSAMAVGDSFLIEPTRYAARNLNVSITDPSAIAAAGPFRTGASFGNAGTGAITPGTVLNPANPALKNPVTITFANGSPLTYNVTGAGTGNPVGVTYTPGQNISYNGWNVSISGTPKVGDTFTISPNNNGVADNRNAGLLADLQVANTLAGGTASYQGAYAQITSSIGNTARDMQISSKAQEAISLRARETQQALSGVNLDEEAANLMRYQQAYQAAGKVVQVASTLFDTILAIGR